MRAFHRVHKVSLGAACDSLQLLINERLLPDLDIDETMDGAMVVWVEKACATYTLFLTSEWPNRNDLSIEQLRTVYDTIAQSLHNSISGKATHAMQVLLWKAANKARDHEVMDKWLQLLRHPLFSAAGEVNKAKIGRFVLLSVPLVFFANVLQGS